MFAYSFTWPSVFEGGDYSTSLSELSTGIQVKFFPHWHEGIAMEWQFPTTWGDCSFNVYRSESEAGAFDLLNPAILSDPRFVDPTSRQTSKFSKDYYRIEVLLNSDGVSSTGTAIPSGSKFITEPLTWENQRTKWAGIRAADIIRREQLMLRKFIGVDSLIFKRKTYGKRCTVCWDERFQKSTRDDCPSCYGTTFDGGYFTPVKTRFQYDVTPNRVVLTYFGKLEPNELTAWTTNFPSIDSHDIVARLPDYKVYRVEDIATTELQAVTVRQIVRLTELDKSVIENRLV